MAKLLGGKVKVIGTGSAPLGIEIRKFCMTAFSCPVVQARDASCEERAETGYKSTHTHKPQPTVTTTRSNS